MNLFHPTGSAPGHFIHALNHLLIPRTAGIQLGRFQSEPLSSLLDDEIDSLSQLTVVLPITRETSRSLEPLNRMSVVNAVNDGRCKLVLDQSNEGGSTEFAELISSKLLHAGIRDASRCLLICQNRLCLPGKSSKYVSIANFDRTLLRGICAANSLLTEIERDTLISAITKNKKPFSVLCLNATPRLHRIQVVLELIRHEIIDHAWLCSDKLIKVPYVSLGALNYSKGEVLCRNDIIRRLSASGFTVEETELDALLMALPLKIDKYTEEGNKLSGKIDLCHYLDTNLSVVTETGTGARSQRITEKTAKALALGHPFVVIGHKASVELVRDFGFSAFDEFIDHSYDTEEDSTSRINKAILSAQDFLKRLSNGDICPDRLGRQAAHNISWANTGFFNHYWDYYAMPVIRECLI